MDDVEERVAYLEGKFEVQVVMVNEIREDVARLERRFDQLEQRLDQRFAVIDQRFLGIDDRLDKMTSLLWGLLVAVVVAAVGGAAGLVTVILRP